MAFLGPSAYSTGPFRSPQAIPLFLEPNTGQAPAGVQALLHSSQLQVALEQDGSLRFLPHQARLRFVGANPRPRITFGTPAQSYSRYIRMEQGRLVDTVARHATSIRVHHLYPGIDAVFHPAQNHPEKLEYDFVVSPQADPGRIRLRWEQTGSPTLSPEGNVTVPVGQGRLLQQQAPISYQPRGAATRPVKSHYRMAADGCLQIHMGEYDRRQPLVIDPVLEYGTAWGGSAFDEAVALATDPSGHVYLAGYTGSSNLPGTTYTVQGAADLFVAKFLPHSTSVAYVVYVGSSGYEELRDLAIDPRGDVYLTGRTTSPTFPRTTGAYQTAFAGGSEGFAVKLNGTTGALQYATLFGGAGEDEPSAIAVDASGQAYVTGSTSSQNLPVSSGALQARYGGGQRDGFVAKFNATGSGLLFSTYLGGSRLDAASAITLDSAGAAYVVGSTESPSFTGIPASAPAPAPLGGSTDGFAIKLNAAGTGALIGTYLGGSGVDWCQAAALDASGNLVVAGYTTSPNLLGLSGQSLQPVLGGGYDGFLVRLSAAALMPLSATYLGGAGQDTVQDVAINSEGSILATGYTASSAWLAGQLPVSSPTLYMAKLTGETGAIRLMTYLANANETDVARVALTRSSTGTPEVLWAGASSGVIFPSSFLPPGTPPTERNTFFAKLANADLQVSNLRVSAGAMSGSPTSGTVTALAGTELTLSLDLDLGSGEHLRGVTTADVGVLQLQLPSTLTVVACSPLSCNAAGQAALGARTAGQRISETVRLRLPGNLPDQSTLRVTADLRSALHDPNEANSSQSLNILLRTPVPVLLQTLPSGLSLTVDGQARTTPLTESWLPGSQHQIAAAPQQASGDGQTRHVLQAWEGSIAQTASAITVTVPSSSASYLARYQTQHRLTLQATPASGGSLSAQPIGDNGFYASGTRVTVTANPVSSSIFSGFAGHLAGTASPQILTVDQPRSVTASFPAHPCSATLLSTGSGGAPMEGGTLSVGVSASSDCTWTASSGADWIQIRSGASGKGNGTVTLQVQPNYGVARTAGLTLANRGYTVAQAAYGCSYAVSTATLAVPVGGATGTLTVTASSICSWSTTVDATWIIINAGQAGSGTGTIRYTVAPNTGPARAGTLTVGGQPVRVTQAAYACSYAVSAATVDASAGGATGTLTLTAPSHCSWSTVVDANWITLTAGQIGNGTGTVGYTLTPNTGPARVGTIIVGGQPVRITQAAYLCNYALSLSAVEVSLEGGTSEFTVTAPAACSWSVAHEADWLTVIAGASGTGTGQVRYTVARNNGAARSVNLLVAGQAMRVTQHSAVEPQAPWVDAVTPAAGVALSQVFEVVYADSNGGADISSVALLFNYTLNESSACSLEVHIPSNTVRLRNDAGTAWLGPLPLGQPGSLQNSRCTVDAAASSTTVQGERARALLAVQYAPAFTGRVSLFTKATDQAGLLSDWLTLGTWWPGSGAGMPASRYRLYGLVTRSHLHTTDLNEYTILGGTGAWNQEGISCQLFNAPVIYQGVTATPFWRIYNTAGTRHFWTADRNEYVVLTRTFRGLYVGEGVDGFVLPQSAPGAIPLYRLNHQYEVPVLHHWTTDRNEYDVLSSMGWRQEGVAGYVLPAP